MSENSIMTIADFHISEMTAETAAAIELHNSIVSAMKEAAFALVSLCENLKRMRDTGQYKALGFDKFEAYTEQACCIKKRQAYNYIATYERLGGTFLQSNAQLGITKLQLLTEVCAVDRAEFVEENDLEGMTVAEVKALIDKNKQLGEQITLLSDENKELKSRPTEVAVREPSAGELAAAVEEKTRALKEQHARELRELKQQNRESLKKAKEKAKAEAEAEKAKAVRVAEKITREQAAAEYEERLKAAEAQQIQALKKAEEAARRLDKNADAELVKASLYFTEAQQTLDNFVASASAIAERDPEKGSKLKALAASVLRKYTDKLQ